MRYYEIIATVLAEADSISPIKPIAPGKPRTDANQTKQVKRTRHQAGGDGRWQTPPRPAPKGPGTRS